MAVVSTRVAESTGQPKLNRKFDWPGSWERLPPLRTLVGGALPQRESAFKVKAALHNPRFPCGITYRKQGKA